MNTEAGNTPPMTPEYLAVLRRVTFTIEIAPNVAIVLEEVGNPTTAFVVGKQTPGPSLLGGKGFFVGCTATFETFDEAEDEIRTRLAAYPKALASFTGSDAS